MTINTGQRQAKTVRCPYIPEHIMPQQSLLNHLSKCSATNKHLFTKCRYNPLHVYPNNLIEEHYKKCKDRIKFEQQRGQSSDDWDSGSQKNQQPQIVEILQKRGGNRGNEKENSQFIDESTIKKLCLSSSDDQSWDPIFKDSIQNVNESKTANQSDFDNSRGNRNKNNQSKIQSVQRSRNKSQNSSFQQKSMANQKNKRYIKQQKSMSIPNKQQKQDSEDIVSLDSQSFSSDKSKSIQKKYDNKNESSCQSLRSYTNNEKSRDNLQQNSKIINSKSLVEENLQVDDF